MKHRALLSLWTISALFLAAAPATQIRTPVTGPAAQIRAPVTAPATQVRWLSTGPVYVQWLRVDSYHPRTLYAGGTLTCTASSVDHPCPSWAMKSTNGGASWSDLSTALHINDGRRGVYDLSPFMIARDGRHLYVETYTDAGSPGSMSTGLLRSTDGGRSWQDSGDTEGGYGGGYTNLTLSPLSVNRLYAVVNSGYGHSGGIASSNDAGANWRSGGDPSALASNPDAYRPWGDLVADPARPNTVYSNVETYDTSAPAFAARSDDAGVHWTRIMTPTVTPPLRTFTVGTDPHDGALLVGRTEDSGAPSGRVYLSANEGRTWRAATCPGDLHGTCPTYTVDNVFGAGAAYAFARNGIYRFHDGGPAESRLSLDAHLPFHTADLLDVGAGTRAGDPIYLLGKGTRGNAHGLLYRSIDRGKTWQRIVVQ